MSAAKIPSRDYSRIDKIIAIQSLTLKSNCFLNVFIATTPLKIETFILYHQQIPNMIYRKDSQNDNWDNIRFTNYLNTKYNDYKKNMMVSIGL